MLAVLATLATLSPSPRAGAHPLTPTEHYAAGAQVSMGAAIVWQGQTAAGLLEWYAHTTGAASERRDSTLTDVGAAQGPWVAAMFYPYWHENNTTTFTVRPADKVVIHPTQGGTIRFKLPGVGSVKLTLSGSSATPRSFPQFLTTPGEHHGHTWDMGAVLVRAVPTIVSGTITKGSTTSTIKPLKLDGATIAWIGEAAALQILAN